VFWWILWRNQFEQIKSSGLCNVTQLWREEYRVEMILLIVYRSIWLLLSYYYLKLEKSNTNVQKKILQTVERKYSCKWVSSSTPWLLSHFDYNKLRYDCTRWPVPAWKCPFCFTNKLLLHNTNIALHHRAMLLNQDWPH